MPANSRPRRPWRAVSRLLLALTAFAAASLGAVATAQPDDSATQTLQLGRFVATVSWNEWQFGMKEWTWAGKIDEPEGREIPDGGVLLAQISHHEYLVTGRHARISFGLANKDEARGFIYARVEEGHFDERGEWVFERVWNGDQTDYGLNFTSVPQLLKVKLATY